MSYARFAGLFWVALWCALMVSVVRLLFDRIPVVDDLF